MRSDPTHERAPYEFVDDDELRCGDLRVIWQDSGEGHHGDYDSEDPEDEPLLRFYVDQRDPQAAEDDLIQWNQLQEECSYCTAGMHAEATTPAERRAGLRLIMDRVLDALEAGRDPDRACQELSWMERTWFAPGAAPDPHRRENQKQGDEGSP
jgi:hypothetical protein